MKVIDQIDTMLSKGIPSTHLDERNGLSFSLLCEYHPFVGKFFLEMVSDTPLMSLPPAEFHLKPMDHLLWAEVHFEKSSPHLLSYFERLRYEIEIGARSPYHAARILEMKVLAMDDKRRLIQERVFGMVRRFPKRFDYDLVAEMQQFFLSFSDEYFRCREVRQMAHTLMALYEIRKKVVKNHENSPKRRHVYLSLSKKRLHYPLGQKESLTVCVGMNSVRENEIFKKNHLLKAIQNLCPASVLVEKSEYEGGEGLHLIALEVEKEGGFSLEEIRNLKVWLPRVLKGKIEHLQRAVFMPRNEEEILKHMITLGKELRFARDLPQLILSFEKQTETQLIFTVVLARVLLSDTPPIEDILCITKLRPKIDRVKQLGMIRKKYPKEAVVFKVELPLEDFLREDHAVDLYQARQKILQELQEVFGDLRDYNGGMISKQNEVFLSLKTSLGKIAEKHHHLLENFFHSLFPLEKRSFLDPEKLKNLFLLLLEMIHSSERILIKEKEHQYYVVSENPVVEKISSPLISLDLEYDERSYFGYIGFENIDEFSL
ncbi:MAG: hypothetical protein AB7N99_07605 [Simkaniaceae bacterium]